MFSICYVFSLRKKGVSLNILQTLSKLTWAWNINTQKIVCFFCGQKLKLSKFCCEFGVSLEILQTHSKLKCFRFVLAIFSLLIFLVGKDWVSNINTHTHKKKKTCFPRCPKHIYIVLWSKGEIFKVWLRVKSLDPSSLQNHLSLEHKPNRQQIFFLTGENQNVPRLVYTSGVILILLFFWKAQRQTNTNMYPKARLEAFKDLSVSDFG